MLNQKPSPRAARCSESHQPQTAPGWHTSAAGPHVVVQPPCEVLPVGQSLRQRVGARGGGVGRDLSSQGERLHRLGLRWGLAGDSLIQETSVKEVYV